MTFLGDSAPAQPLLWWLFGVVARAGAGSQDFGGELCDFAQVL